MQRVRDDLNVFSPEVTKYVFQEGTDWAEDSTRVIGMKEDLVQCLKPMEIQVTKSKEKGKGYYRFILFCTKNLRLYNNVQEYFLDISELNGNSAAVTKKINRLKELSGLSVDNPGVEEQLVSMLPTFDNSDSEENDLGWAEDAIGF